MASSLHPTVIQGFFLGNRPRIQVPQQRPGAVQLSPTRGPAMQLPPAVLNLRPSRNGQRLPEAIQRKMETIFGTGFSEVRIHVGNEAASIGAVAFTHGSDLYFAHGQYNPSLPHGQRLLGHELAHVVQQRLGRVRNPFGTGMAIVQDPGLEAEAERMGIKVAMHFGREASGTVQQKPAGAHRHHVPVPTPKFPTPPMRLARVSKPFSHPAMRTNTIQRSRSGHVIQRMNKIVLPQGLTAESEEMGILTEIQAILLDTGSIAAAIQQLEQDVAMRVEKQSGSTKKALTGVLNDIEKKYGIGNTVRLWTDLLSEQEFLMATSDGQMFKDVGAGARHGEATHRIQWYIILHATTKGFTQNLWVFPKTPSEILSWVNKTKTRPVWKEAPEGFGTLWDAVFDRAAFNPSFGLDQDSEVVNEGVWGAVSEFGATSPEALHLDLINGKLGKTPTLSKILAARKEKRTKQGFHPLSLSSANQQKYIESKTPKYTQLGKKLFELKK